MHRKILLLLLVASFVSMTACGKKAPPELTRPAPKAAAVQPARTDAIAAENDFMRIARDMTPAVVNIRTTQSVEEGGASMFGDKGQMPKDKYHGYGDGGGGGKKHSETSVGSGVIISDDGYIVTNAHVVTDATEIKIKLTDKKEFVAKLIGVDSKTDIAVLKIESGEKLPKAALGDSANLQPGQWAIAIGNPFGLDHTITVGVVSAVGRADVGVAQYENFIQTDASVNPGNSGGPLLNSRGEVIGITTAIMSAGQGISFAIPVNMAKDVARALIEKGKVVRGWLGVEIQTLTPELAQGLSIPGRSGVLVNKIYPGSPAEKARFAVRDVIVEFDGAGVTEARQLQNTVAGTAVGKSVGVKVIRDGSEKVLKVRVEELGDIEPKDAQEKPKTEESKLLGITVYPMDEMRGAGGKGVVVVEVEGGGPAEKAGILSGDVVTSIGRKKVEGLADFRAALSGAKKGDTVLVLVTRAKSPLFIALKTEP
ncbi:MAG TPA: Do family serine endopeptidase [Nitrospirota bacterium]|nr:Do family serine endopeptidase [Nitrospirota bacterium]